MLASTLSRPRWAMPMTISRTPQSGGLLDDRVEERDERLAPFEREPLLADVARVEELLEQLGVVQPSQDAAASCSRRTAGWFRIGSIRSWSQRRHGEVLDVHVLDADGPAVGLRRAAIRSRKVALGQAAKSAGSERCGRRWLSFRPK